MFEYCTQQSKTYTKFPVQYEFLLFRKIIIFNVSTIKNKFYLKSLIKINFPPSVPRKETPTCSFCSRNKQVEFYL